MKVAVIDDDENARNTIGFYIDDIEYEPVFIEGHYDSIDEIIKVITTSADAAVCDHRLQNGGLGSFYGSELVSRLIEIGFPAILITQFLDIDADVSIRKYREHIPYATSRDHASGDCIKELIQKTINETESNIENSRIPHRAILRIENITTEAGEDVADAVIETWNPNKAIRFPLSLMGQCGQSVSVGKYYFAKVNTGAVESSDIYLTDFEDAPEPVDATEF